jgi:hypothetical protein
MTALAAPGVPHRMSDPAVRLRVAVMVAALLALGWAAVSLAGRPTGFYTQEELRHVGGLPLAPPQIQRRVAPIAPAGPDLEQQLRELSDALTGVSPAPQAPTPGAR